MATHSSILAWKKFYGQRSLAGYSPWGCKESDTTEHLSAATACTILFHMSSVYPLQPGYETAPLSQKTSLMLHSCIHKFTSPSNSPDLSLVPSNHQSVFHLYSFVISIMLYKQNHIACNLLMFLPNIMPFSSSHVWI